MLSTKYDALFSRFANGVPVPFLRALSYKESSHDPTARTGSAVGLFQITPTVLDGYNSSKGTQLTQGDLNDPAVNTKIGTDLLLRISAAYGKHPSKNLKPDWGNPEFVRLVLAGWNSGYSEGGGVGKVATYLESRGITVTHDNVFHYASAAGATQHLSNTAKQVWQRDVASLFYMQHDWSRGGIGGSLILLAVLVYAVLR